MPRRRPSMVAGPRPRPTPRPRQAKLPRLCLVPTRSIRWSKFRPLSGTSPSSWHAAEAGLTVRNFLQYVDMGPTARQDDVLPGVKDNVMTGGAHTPPSQPQGKPQEKNNTPADLQRENP